MRTPTWADARTDGRSVVLEPGTAAGSQVGRDAHVLTVSVHGFAPADRFVLSVMGGPRAGQGPDG